MRKPDRRKRPGGPVVHTDGFPGDIPHFDEERANVRFRHYLKLCGRKRGPGYFRPSNGWACEGAQTIFRRTKHGRRVYPGGLTGRAAVGRFALLFCLLSLCVLLSGSASAAINPTMQWDVRTTGADTNGGGFDPNVSVPGTDFSQANGPAVTYTDLTIGASTSTYISALNPVGATLPGNVVIIGTAVSGTCTAGRYEVLSNATITATVDRALGTAGSVCNALLGGSLATVSTGLAAMVAQNTLWIHSGTFTLTSALTVQNLANLSMFGYGSTHGDMGTKPLITTATNSTILLNIPTGLGNQPFVINNISFSNTAGTRAVCIEKTSNSGAQVGIANALLNGCSVGLDFNASQPAQLSIFNTEIENSVSDAVRSNDAYNAVSVVNCYIHDNGGWGLKDFGNTAFAVTGSVFARNASGGILSNNLLYVSNSVFYKNTGDGVQFSGASQFWGFGSSNSVYYGNGGWGIDNTQSVISTPASFYQTNAYGGPNGSGNVRHVIVLSSASDIALSADPFVNGATGNFALNSTAGGGAALTGAGFPGVMPAGTGHLDVGALQSQAATASVTAVGYVQ